MLAANEAVATLLAERLPHTAFLRRHPPPTAKQIKEAQTSLKSIGVDVQIGSAGALQVPYINLTFFCSILRIPSPISQTLITFNYAIP